MEIYVLDGLNGVIGIVSTFESAIWNVQYYGRNDLQLIVPGTEENIDLLQEGRLLVRDCDIEQIGTGIRYQNVMRIESIKLDYDTEKGYVMTIAGKGLKNILSQRVIWNQINVENVFLAPLIFQVLNQNVISPTDPNRKISNFIAGAVEFETPKITMQLLGENVADWLEEVCTTYGIGWDVIIYNGNYIFTLYQGTDRSYNQSTVPPVVFSPEFDNLLSSSYTYNREEYKNAALVGGEGEGTSQRTASIGTASGLNRYEAYVDGSSVSSNGEIITEAQYTAMLQEYGNQQLTQTAFTESFDGEIMTDGVYKINEDFFLGDVVQAENELGISATTRLIEIIFSEDQNGTQTLGTFSEWEVD